MINTAEIGSEKKICGRGAFIQSSFMAAKERLRKQNYYIVSLFDIELKSSHVELKFLFDELARKFKNRPKTF